MTGLLNVLLTVVVQAEAESQRLIKRLGCAVLRNTLSQMPLSINFFRNNLKKYRFYFPPTYNGGGKS